jgi:hypothetical protein
MSPRDVKFPSISLIFRHRINFGARGRCLMATDLGRVVLKLQQLKFHQQNEFGEYREGGRRAVSM